MSANWSAQDLLGVLKKRDVPRRRVRVGDVVVGEHGPEHVAEVRRDSRGQIGLMDAWENGTYGHPDRMVTIIDRQAIDLYKSRQQKGLE